MIASYPGVGRLWPYLRIDVLIEAADEPLILLAAAGESQLLTEDFEFRPVVERRRDAHFRVSAADVERHAAGERSRVTEHRDLAIRAS